MNTEVSFTMLNIRNNLIAEPDYQLFETCDALVIASPAYFGGLPSHLLDQLVRLEEYFNSHRGSKSGVKGRMRVYGLVNCGHFDGHDTEFAVAMIELWTKRCGLEWGCGAGFGGGEMLGMITSVPFGKGPLKTPGKIMTQFGEAIIQGGSMENLFATPDYARFIFMNNANTSMWEKRAKENGITRKQMYYRVP